MQESPRLRKVRSEETSSLWKKRGSVGEEGRTGWVESERWREGRYARRRARAGTGRKERMMESRKEIFEYT